MNQVPLLVVSCDAYADVWQPFVDLFRKRWPDCPFPLYLGSNHRSFDGAGVTPICTSEDGSWASCVRKMLDQLDSSHVILFLEDFFLTAPVKTPDVVAVVNLAIEKNVDCLRLSPAPGTTFTPSATVHDIEPAIGVLLPQTPYRVSCQPAVWRVDTLKRYLVPGFSAWEFEMLGTQLSEFRDDVFWSAVQPLIAYDHAVEKGKWKPEGLAICRDAGVHVDASHRPSFTEEDLHAHYHNSTPENVASQAKTDVIRTFQAGRRADGLKRVARLATQQPFSLQLWGIAAFGTMGPAPLQWLRRQQLRRRITQALSREPLIASGQAGDFV